MGVDPGAWPESDPLGVGDDHVFAQSFAGTPQNVTQVLARRLGQAIWPKNGHQVIALQRFTLYGQVTEQGHCLGRVQGQV